MSSRVFRITYAFMIATTIAGTTAGLHLTLLTETTRTTFAWHIGNPMTAAFFGAAYVAAGIALTATLLRARRWEELRTAAVVATVFMTSAGVVTLWHVGEFQYDSDLQVAQFVSWVWLALYFGLPVGLIYSVVRQESASGPETYRPQSPLIPSFRIAFGVPGIALAALGIGLCLNLDAAVEMWPWLLPPLSARVVGAWIAATGLTQLWSARENDWTKLKTYALATLGFYPLQFIALARYGDRLDDGLRQWGYTAALALLLILQLAACAAHIQRERRRKDLLAVAGV